MLALAPLVTIFALGVACEDQIVHFGGPDAGSTPSSDGGGVGQGGFTTSLTQVGGSTSISPTGGVAGGMSSSFGGAGGGSACKVGGDSFSMEIDRFDGTKYTCVNLVDAAPAPIQGVVELSDAGSLTVSECPPDQPSCLGEITTVTFAAPGLMMPMIPIGNYVEIEFDIALTQAGCAQRLQITDLPLWDGLGNPGGQDRDLWLAAADGTPDPFIDAPFGIYTDAFGDCGAQGVDAYAFDFYLLSAPQTAVEVLQGDTKTWQVDLPSSDSNWLVRNLRSYQTGNINDTHNWAYWVTPITVQPNGQSPAPNR